MIPPEKIDEIVSRIDIVSLVGEYVSLKPSGQNMKGLCPFHTEKTPSFMVHAQKGIFKCFGCGEGGGPIQFLMKIEGLSFIEAVKMLADRVGVRIKTTRAEKEKLSQKDLLRKIMHSASEFYHEILINSALGKKARIYLNSREIKPKTVEKFKLGFAPGSGDFLIRHLRGRKYTYEQMEQCGLVRRGKGDFYDYFRERLIFPIWDSRGRPVGLAGRGLDESTVPKYLNTPESAIFSKGTLTYGLHLAKQAIRKEEEVFVVEGYTDAISLYQGGIENVVASMGTSLTVEQARQIARYTRRVIFAYDSDTAGASATVRGIEIFEKAGLYVRVMTLPPGEDPDSIIKKKGSDYFKELAGSALGIIDYKIDQLKQKYDLMKSPEDKQEFVRELIPILKGIRGDVRRSEYIRIISERCQLPEEILRRKVREKKIRRQAVDVSSKVGRTKLLPEEKLLAYLLSNPRFIPMCRDFEISSDEFRGELFPLYKKLLQEDIPEDMDVIKASFLNKLVDDEEILKKAVDLSMVEGLPACSEEEIQAIFDKLKRRSARDRISILRQRVNAKLARGELSYEDPDYVQLQSLLKQIKVTNRE